MEPSAAETSSWSSLSPPRALPLPLSNSRPPALGNQGGQHKEVCPKQGHGFGGGCSGRRSAGCWAEVMSSAESQSEHSPLGISKAKLAVPYGNAEQHADTVSGQRNFSQEFMWPDMFSLLHFRVHADLGVTHRGAITQKAAPICCAKEEKYSLRGVGGFVPVNRCHQGPPSASNDSSRSRSRLPLPGRCGLK